jgi:hypothetical protein
LQNAGAVKLAAIDRESEISAAGLNLVKEKFRHSNFARSEEKEINLVVSVGSL